MTTRRVSFRQAVICEQGVGRRCRCRCGGTLHGAKRFGETPVHKDFALLARTDPHHVCSARECRVQLPIPSLEDCGANLSRRRQRPGDVTAAAPNGDVVEVVGTVADYDAGRIVFKDPSR